MAGDRDPELLESLLSGQIALDEAPRDLASLASLAISVTDNTPIERPTDEFRLDLRATLMNVPDVPPTRLERVRDRVESATARLRHSGRVAVATALASSLIGTTGVAAAAQSALPGDLLYPIKTFTEDARLAFAFGAASEGQLHLAFARERLGEVEAGLERLSPTQIRDTLATMDAESAVGAELLLTVYLDTLDTVLLDDVAAFTSSQRQRLLSLSELLPLTVVASAEQSLEVLRRIDVQAQIAATGIQCAECRAAAGSVEPFLIDEDGLRPRVVLPGDGQAVLSGQCDCLPASPEPLPREEPRAEPKPDPKPTPVDPTEPPDPEVPEPPPTVPDDPSGPIDDLTGIVDETGVPATDVVDLVDDLLTELGADNPVESVDDGLEGVLDLPTSATETPEVPDSGL